MRFKLSIFLLCAIIPLSKCHRQRRIALGVEVKPHSKPYQVHIIFVLNDGNAEICGGALISKSYILTAAHCFNNLVNITQTAVIIGAHKLTDQDKDFQMADNFIIHKDYQRASDGFAVNDIALIQLNKPVQLTNNVQLINLPRYSEVNESFTGTNASISGWGKTEIQETSDVLLEAVSEIIEEDEICKFPNKLICSVSIGGAPCTGDSGSPLVFNNTVIGVLSTGYCFIFSYYTRVTSYLSWIQKHSDVKITN